MSLDEQVNSEDNLKAPMALHASLWLLTALGAASAAVPFTQTSTPVYYSVRGEGWVVSTLHDATHTQALTHVVLGQAEVILANLDAMGWNDRSDECAADLPELFLGGRPPDFIFESLERSGQGVQQAFLWQEPTRIKGLPSWAVWVGAVPAHVPVDDIPWHVNTSDDPQGRFTGDMMAGIAELHWAESRTHGVPSVPCIQTYLSADALDARILPPEDAACEPTRPLCQLPGFLPTPLPVTDYPVVWNEGTVGPHMALTFDACSTLSKADYNPAVIAALLANQVPATLFVGGRWAELHPTELRYLASLPLFEIGNHTFTHPHMRQLSPWQQRQELLWTQATIFALTGVLPIQFRPPYGEIDDVLVRDAANLGLYTVEFDLPAGDAEESVSAKRISDWILAKARPGTVVIMHMNRPGNHTAEALPSIVQGLRARGLILGTVSDMLTHRFPAGTSPVRNETAQLQ